jgi:3-hydroxyisobutyrate dehydrogenase-like beta-hydroxyacid dehydrogenase
MTNPHDGNERRTIGLLHPGEMGAAVGAALRAAGQRVLWASAGRSAATAERAAAAGLEDVAEVHELRRRSDVILSVIPPGEAATVASLLEGFGGIYVDANAIAPETTRHVGRIIEAAGGRFVDGGIIGGPPVKTGDTHLYLSGPDAVEVSELFAGTVVGVHVMGSAIGDASAVKMAYAAWTKGTAALLLAVREYARREGVEDALLDQWDLSQPRLRAQWARASESATNKGWRWVAEMQEIASALGAAGLPSGFHEAAAEVFAGSERPAVTLPRDAAG